MKGFRAGRPERVVLVVDDSEVLRSSLTHWLQIRFPLARVHTAGDGETALESARSLRPDVVLMDIGLPGIDGIEATRRIRAHVPGVDVVVLTNHDTPQHRLAAAKAGAAAFIAKQKLDVRLAPVLERLLGARESR